MLSDRNGTLKIAGTSKALVIDNRDPDKRGRIIVDSPFAGETEWIEYLRTPESFNVPQIGDIVYLEAPSGEVDYYRAWGNEIKGPDETPELRDEFRREVPTNRGFYTPGGHLIEFDDGIANAGQDPSSSEQTTEKRGVRITTSEGTKFHILDDDDNGDRRILLEDPDGNHLIIDRENGLIDIKTDGDINIVAGSTATIDTPATTVTGTLEVKDDIAAKAKLEVTGDTTAKANLDVTGTSSLGGKTPLVLSTAQFVGIGNLGVSVISTVMSGQATKVTGN